MDIGGNWLAGTIPYNLLLNRGTAARDPLLDADMMCGCVYMNLFVGQEKCATEKATLQIRPVELLCGASHELSQACDWDLNFFSTSKKKVRTSREHEATSVIGPLRSITVGPFFWQCPSKISAPRPPSILLSSLFPLSRHESLSQGLFPSPGRLVIYTVPRVNPRTTLFSLAAPTVKIPLGTVR